jgi:hypothetical protein
VSASNPECVVCDGVGWDWRKAAEDNLQVDDPVDYYRCLCAEGDDAVKNQIVECSVLALVVQRARIAHAKSVDTLPDGEIDHLDHLGRTLDQAIADAVLAHTDVAKQWGESEVHGRPYWA